MEYSKQTFSNGQVLEAAHLNHIEEGLAQAAADLTTQSGEVGSIAHVDTDVEQSLTEAQQTTARQNISAASIEEVQDVRAQLQKYAPCILSDVSADTVALIDDAASSNALSVISVINPYQSGTDTPSPGNIRPITGRNAANLYRTGENYCSLGTVSFKQYKEYKLDTPIPAGEYSFAAGVTSTDTDHSYAIVHFVQTVGGAIKMMLARGERIKAPLTAAAPIIAIRFYASENYTDGAGDTATFSDIQIAPGTTTDYVPYQGVALTAALPELVYGGTLDWNTGLLTVTHFVQTFDGTEEWTSPSADTYQYYNDTLYTKTASSNQVAYHVCSHFKADRYMSSGNSDNSCYEMNNNKLMVKCTSITTLEDWTAYLAAQAAAGTPVTIVWEYLPKYYTTIQLTPQQLTMLKGKNRIWSDCGDTEVSYIADTKLYIDNAISTLTSAVTGL